MNVMLSGERKSTLWGIEGFIARISVSERPSRR